MGSQEFFMVPIQAVQEQLPKEDEIEARTNMSRVTVKPIPGALIVNIGDFLQLISNGKLKSAEHRVLANRVGPRVSVACFFRGSTAKLYGPIEELSDEDSSIYKHTTVKAYTEHYYSKGLSGVSALNHFKL